MPETPATTGGPDRRSLRLLVAVSLLGPLAALAAVWLPVLRHYQVRTPDVTGAVVAELRRVPDDAVLARLDGLRYGATRQEEGDVVAAADRVLEGTYRTRTGETVPVGPAPTRASVSVGSPMVQLQLSSLAVAQVLLDAYRQTGQERYFSAALRSVLDWARFERGAWLPTDFLWNDHAVAARAVVLADVWRAYRGRTDFDAEVGREILQFAARSAALLARDSHYNARTNHGIMQDLALLHLAVALPGLPGTGGDAELALERLSTQLEYYVSPGGVVLEHSAGYQDFGIRLLRNALVYTDLLGVAPPQGLRERLAAAECFRGHVTRPDGSVPAFGDTFSPTPDAAPEPGAAGPACAAGDVLIDQDFGYASVRDLGGAGGHLLVTWADFPGRAHKHDDELAAWLWLDGRDWWAGSGYWPYGDPDQAQAISWRGANAPHAVGERRGIGRESRLLAYRADAAAPFLDLERRAADGRAYRRQVAALGAEGVLVLDSAAAGQPGGEFESVWTLAPGVAVRETATPGLYDVIDGAGGRELRATFAGGDGHAVQRLRGSRTPFAGLVAVDGHVRTAEALVATAGSGSWSAVAWQRSGAGAAPAAATIHWESPLRWSVTLPHVAGATSLSRDGQRLSYAEAGGAARDVELVEGAATRPLLAAAAARYREARSRYPVFRGYLEYRVQATWGIALLFVGLAAGVSILRRVGTGSGRCVVLLTVAWAAAAWWLYYRYLA